MSKLGPDSADIKTNDLQMEPQETKKLLWNKGHHHPSTEAA